MIRPRIRPPGNIAGPYTDADIDTAVAVLQRWYGDNTLHRIAAQAVLDGVYAARIQRRNARALHLLGGIVAVAVVIGGLLTLIAPVGC